MFKIIFQVLLLLVVVDVLFVRGSEDAGTTETNGELDIPENIDCFGTIKSICVDADQREICGCNMYGRCKFYESQCHMKQYNKCLSSCESS